MTSIKIPSSRCNRLPSADRGTDVFLAPPVGKFLKRKQRTVKFGPDVDPVTYINEQGRMENISFPISLSNGAVVLRSHYNWHISYLDRGRADVTAESTGTCEGKQFVIDFGSFVQGGTFFCSIQVILRLNGKETCCRVEFAGPILGRNPSKDSIRGVLGSTDAQVRAYLESRFRQFDSGGQPLWGPPNGFGVMQLDNPSPPALALWSWQANVETALQLIDAKKKETRQHYQNLYNAYPKAPHLTAEQIKLAEYRRYNGGWYWDWDNQNRKWVALPGEPYADNALALEKQVISGNFPPDW